MAIKVINGKQALGKRLKVELKKGGFGPSSSPNSRDQGSNSRHSGKSGKYRDTQTLYTGPSGSSRIKPRPEES
jgi:hypothetical protein